MISMLFAEAHADTLLAVTAAGVVIAAGSVLLLLQSRKKGKSANPFTSDTREAAKPHEFDRSKRDSVLKNGFSEKKLAALGGDIDAIVIGSGIGGLTAAAIMARAGKKVVVLEQHDQCGGCCHSFHEKGFEFDTGIHYIGEMRNNTAFRFLMDQLSNGHLGWANVRDDFDTVVLVDSGSNDHSAATAAARDSDAAAVQRLDAAIAAGTPLASKQISFMSGEKETIHSLCTAFPGEEEAIYKYFALLGKVRKSMLGFIALKALPQWLGQLAVTSGLVHWMSDYFKYAAVSTTDTIKTITNNPTLRAVLSYNFGDYGTIPKDAPFTMHAILQNHFLRGVSFPVGGSSEISFHIVPTILKSGGAVFVRAEVSSILLDAAGKRAVGVQLKRGAAAAVEIRAPIVISAAGLYNTVNKLLPAQCKPLFAPMLGKVRHGFGGISVYVGLKGTAEELQLNGKHYWAMWTKSGDEDLDAICESYLQRPQQEAATAGPIPLLFISFPSAKDPLWPQKHPGKSTCTIVTVGDFHWFSAWEEKRVMHRGADYESLKQQFGAMIWKQTLALFPQLQDKVEYFDVGTPITNNYYLAASEGEMYGADHNMSRFTPQAAVSLRCETPLSGLFLSGQDAFTCGFAGATFGGVFCASSVLNRNVYEDLVKLKNKSAPSVAK